MLCSGCCIPAVGNRDTPLTTKTQWCGSRTGPRNHDQNKGWFWFSSATCSSCILLRIPPCPHVTDKKAEAWGSQQWLKSQTGLAKALLWTSTDGQPRQIWAWQLLPASQNMRSLCGTDQRPPRPKLGGGSLDSCVDQHLYSRSAM